MGAPPGPAGARAGPGAVRTRHTRETIGYRVREIPNQCSVPATVTAAVFTAWRLAWNRSSLACGALAWRTRASVRASQAAGCPDGVPRSAVEIAVPRRLLRPMSRRQPPLRPVAASAMKQSSGACESTSRPLGPWLRVVGRRWRKVGRPTNRDEVLARNGPQRYLRWWHCCSMPNVPSDVDL